MAENNDDRSRGKGLQGILNMTIKLSDAESKELEPTSEMDEQRKEFLQNAIHSVLENDDGKKLVMFTKQFLQCKFDDVYTEDQLAEISDVFEVLNYLLEGLDMANDFNKLGGLKHSLSLLRSNYSSIQWRSADIIANCVQNNPQNQYSLIEDKGIESLLYVLKKTDVDMVRVKCLYALSGLIGGNNVAEKLFVDLKGLNIALMLLTNDNLKIRLKSAFLIRKIIISDSETVRFVDNKVDIALQLIELLKMDHDDTHEVAADILLNLVNADENTKYEYKKMDHLKELFSTRKNDLHINDADKFEELIDIYKELIELL